MGEARRRKLAGYVPETKPDIKRQPRRRVTGSMSGIGALAMIAAMVGDYPKLPDDVLKVLRR